MVDKAQSIRDFLIMKLWQGLDPFAKVSASSERVDFQGWSGSRHPWLDQAVEELSPRIIVEIGVWKGASTLQMAETLKRTGVPGVVIAIDTWLGSSEHRMNADWFAGLCVQDGHPTIHQTFMANVCSRGLQNYVLTLPLDSLNAAELLRHAEISADLIHIDAGHDFRSITVDIEAWWPLLRTGGILLGNDYYADGALFPGVKAAFDSFTSSHYLAFDHNLPKIRIYKPQSRSDLSEKTPRCQDEPKVALNRSLPPTLEYSGEFGPELVLCLPYLNWLSKLGLLKDRRIVTYKGMRCFYDELDCVEIVEKTDTRKFVEPAKRAPWLPVRNEHDFDGQGQSPLHLYPDLRGKFAKLPLLPQIVSPERPLLIIHNKYANEWDKGAVNYITLDSLKLIFMFLGKEFTIVYVRHGISVEQHDFVGDHNVQLPFNDRSLLDAHPEVLCFDDLYEQHRSQGGLQDLNTFKNVLYSRCYHFITSQGGGAHQIALYSGSLLAILHRQGSEERWAYERGYYTFMATVPPLLAICRGDDALLRALPLFLGSAVICGRAFVSAGNQNRLAELSTLNK